MAVLNDLEKGLKVARMTCALVMLPVVSVGEDFIFPRRQLALLSILGDGVLEDEERVFLHPAVKRVSNATCCQSSNEGILTRWATRRF